MKSMHSQFKTKSETIGNIHYARNQVWFLRLKYCNSKCSPLVNDLHSVWKKRWKSKIGDRLIRRRCTLCSSKWGAIPKHPLSIEVQVDIISILVQLILNYQCEGKCLFRKQFHKVTEMTVSQFGASEFSGHHTLCSWKCHSSKVKDSLIIFQTHMVAVLSVERIVVGEP